MICDLQEDVLHELDLLRDVFISNGYPEHLVPKTLREYKCLFKTFQGRKIIFSTLEYLVAYLFLYFLLCVCGGLKVGLFELHNKYSATSHTFKNFAFCKYPAQSRGLSPLP